MTVGAQTQPLGKLLDYEQFIDHQLDRTRRRIKLTDVATACLILLVGFLGVLFLEVLGDHLFGMPYWLRSAILVTGLVAAIGYAAYRVALPLVLRINGLYAAKTIEISEPAFKNSLINYLELKRHPDQLPRAVLGALESRAVNDLTKVDVDGVVNQRRMIHMVYALTGVVVVFCIYCAVSPRSPMDSVRRAFLADVIRPTNTQFVNIKPGDNQDLSEIVSGQHVSFQVDVQGVRPERVLLHHSVDGGKFFAIKELAAGKRLYDAWQFTMTNVQQSMDYYFTGGDAESRHFHLDVKPAPTIVTISHDLDFPSYTRIDGRKDIEGGEVEAIEGTKVTVHARTNMPAKRATINFATPDVQPAILEVLESDPTQLTGKFTVAKSGTYHIDFRTVRDQVNPSPVNYDIIAITDKPPTARFVLPAQPTVKVPANVKVDLQMTGSDDHGVKEATLHVQQGKEIPSSKDMLEGREVKPDFRAEEKLDLAQLKARPGDKLTYWLTVRDNKEPASNRFETARQIIEVGDPVAPQEKKKFEDKQLKDRQQLNPSAQNNPDPTNQVEPQENPQARDDQNLKDGGKADQQQGNKPGKAAGAGSQQDTGQSPEDGATPQNGQPGNDQNQLTPEQIRKAQQIINKSQAKRAQQGQRNAPGSGAPGSQPQTGNQDNAQPAAGANGAQDQAQAAPPVNRNQQQNGQQGGPGNNQGPTGNANPGDEVAPGIQGNNQLSQGQNPNQPRSAPGRTARTTRSLPASPTRAGPTTTAATLKAATRPRAMPTRAETPAPPHSSRPAVRKTRRTRRARTHRIRMRQVPRTARRERARGRTRRIRPGRLNLRLRRPASPAMRRNRTALNGRRRIPTRRSPTRSRTTITPPMVQKARPESPKNRVPSLAPVPTRHRHRIAPARPRMVRRAPIPSRAPRKVRGSRERRIQTVSRAG